MNLMNSYYKVCEKYVSRLLLTNSMPEMVAKEHNNLRGKSKAECNRLFMFRVRTWPLYGSHVFEVSVHCALIISKIILETFLKCAGFWYIMKVCILSQDRRRYKYFHY